MNMTVSYYTIFTQSISSYDDAALVSAFEVGYAAIPKDICSPILKSVNVTSRGQVPRLGGQHTLVQLNNSVQGTLTNVHGR